MTVERVDLDTPEGKAQLREFFEDRDRRVPDLDARCTELTCPHHGEANRRADGRLARGDRVRHALHGVGEVSVTSPCGFYAVVRYPGVKAETSYARTHHRSDLLPEDCA